MFGRYVTVGRTGGRRGPCLGLTIGTPDADSPGIGPEMGPGIGTATLNPSCGPDPPGRVASSHQVPSAAQFRTARQHRKEAGTNG